MAYPVTFRFARSTRLGGALLAASAGGVGCVAASGAPWWATALAAAFALLLCRHGWRTQVTRNAAEAVTEMGVDVDGDWWLATRNGGARSVRMVSTAVHRWAVVVTCRDEGGARYAVFLAPDAVGGDEFRLLSARLRMQVMTNREGRAVELS